MDDTQKLEVSKENVFQVVQAFYDYHGKLPFLREIRERFCTPSSRKIDVYLSEWREENQGLIAETRDTKEAWRLLARKYGAEVAELRMQIQQLHDDYASLCDSFAKANHDAYIAYTRQRLATR